jgi:hypothetical protein
MWQHEEIITQPVFLLFLAFSFALTLGYYWGRRQNKKIFHSALTDLVEIVKPDDQTFTNIGGAIGYHANLLVRRKGPVSRVDATITLLPRHSWMYLPISKLIRKYDRLFITIHLESRFPEEAHLIEVKHAGLGQRRIDNPGRFKREDIKWGRYAFYLYSKKRETRDRFLEFIQNHPDPGIVRHIALVPHQHKAFVFVIPRKGQVGRYFSPIYQWITATMSEPTPSQR